MQAESSEDAGMNSVNNPYGQAAETLMMRCPVCDSDASETLGITGAMDRSLGATVVMCCDECHTVYLAPPPADGAACAYDWETAYVPAIGKMKQDVAANARVFSADSRPESVFARDPDTERFDRVLLPLSMESTSDPDKLMARAARLLDAGGQLDVLVGNNASWCFKIFGGRH